MLVLILLKFDELSEAYKIISGTSHFEKLLEPLLLIELNPFVPESTNVLPNVMDELFI